MTRDIPVAAPVLAGNEADYVLDCVESGWISSKGEYVNRFEEQFAQFCGVDYASTCCNGTVALHLALEALDIGSGDEVIVPDLTFVSTANVVRFVGAEPTFVDVDPETWTMDPTHLEAAVSKKTAAIIPVHLYGHPADMAHINDVAEAYDVAVIEDAAEAHGATIEGQYVGSTGDVATFSFYGNKIVTTGEGGIVTTDNEEVFKRIDRLKNHCMDPDRRYWFTDVGYNYRMTNIQAALGCAQMEDIDWHLERRWQIASWYDEHLEGCELIQRPVERDWARHSYWMYCVLLDETVERDEIMDVLKENGVETRPFFYPMTSMPPYYDDEADTEVAYRVAAQGINLPTWAGLEEDDVEYVCSTLKDALSERATA